MIDISWSLNIDYISLKMFNIIIKFFKIVDKRKMSQLLVKTYL